MKLIRNTFILLIWLIIGLSAPLVEAAPYFYLSGSSVALRYVTHTLDLYLVTDGSTLTATQTLINFDNVRLEAKSISILNSACSFWAPADPSLGYGNSPSPYFYPTSNSNRVVFSCGFTNPGYTSADADGDLIAKIRFTPISLGSTSLSFSAPNSLYRFIGTPIVGDTLSNFNIDIYDASASSIPSPTPTITSSTSPTPTPSPTATASATPTPSPISPLNVTDTLTADQLNFVEIGVNTSETTTAGEDVTLQIVDEDDSIPAPPVLEPRPNATPFQFNLLGESGNQIANEIGEVLSAQSLRELLIPGKSTADKTVVMVNLISTLTFLALLAIVIWRLVTITRMNRLKSQHMKDLLASELAVLESKLNTANTPEQAAQIKEEISQTIEKLKKDS